MEKKLVKKKLSLGQEPAFGRNHVSENELSLQFRKTHEVLVLFSDLTVGKSSDNYGLTIYHLIPQHFEDQVIEEGRNSHKLV